MSLNITIVPNFLDSLECKQLIEKYSAKLNQLYDKGRSRTIFDSRFLANTLFDRATTYLHKFSQITDEFGDIWHIKSLNDRFRFVKYESGQAFNKHVDGNYQPNIFTRSFCTFMMYLNTVPIEAGGTTTYMKHGLTLQPLEGCLCIFEVEDVEHEGTELLNGKKYILRTDVMYSCTSFKDPRRVELYHLFIRAQELEDQGDPYYLKLWERYFNLRQAILTHDPMHE